MPSVLFDPINSLLRLQEEIDRMFTQPHLDVGLSNRANVFPPLNAFSDKDGLVVRAEVPGISPDQVEVQVEARRLEIKGERKPAPAASGGSYHRRERRFGRFSRALQLPPDLDVSRATAECRNGVLTVRIPKLEAVKPRTIEVRAA